MGGKKGVKLGKRNSSPERGLENQEDKVWMRGAERERLRVVCESHSWEGVTLTKAFSFSLHWCQMLDMTLNFYDKSLPGMKASVNEQ